MGKFFIGLLITILIAVIQHFNYKPGFVTWWPSGWIVAIIIVIIFLIISSRKIRTAFFRRKYGPGTGKELVRASGNKVYLILNDKIRKWIKNQKTLHELGYDWDQVGKIEREKLDQYKEGKPISIYFFK